MPAIEEGTTPDKAHTLVSVMGRRPRVSNLVTLVRRIDGAARRGSQGSRFHQPQNREQTVKYLMLIKNDERYREQAIPPALMDAMGKFVEESFKSGELVDTGGLKPSSEGTLIHVSRGRAKVKDGPFTEAKEVIGGYAIVQADTRERAMDIAQQFVDLHLEHWPGFDFECEIRPMDAM